MIRSSSKNLVSTSNLKITSLKLFLNINGSHWWLMYLFYGLAMCRQYIITCFKWENISAVWDFLFLAFLYLQPCIRIIFWLNLQFDGWVPRAEDYAGQNLFYTNYGNLILLEANCWTNYRLRCTKNKKLVLKLKLQYVQCTCM